MAEETIRLYVISVEDRCPRCLKRIPREAAAAPKTEGVDAVMESIVCPNCEAILSVCDIQILEDEET